MRKNKFLLAAAGAAAAGMLALGAFAADNLVYEFTDEQSLSGWGVQTIRYNFDPGYFNGYAYEQSANKSDCMLISPTLNINAEDYRYVIVNMNYNIDAGWSRNGTMFFTVPGSNWDAAHSVSGPKYASGSSGGFTDVVFDMSKCELWTGTIKQIRLDPFEAHGSIQVKSITFTDTLPEATEEDPGKTETENPAEKEEPKKETGVFLKPNVYAYNFADVPGTEWYAGEIANAYELGLINGKSDTAFDPDGSMTVAEAITLAARTRNAYGTADYDFTPAEGAEWFEPYVEYAAANGIISDGKYSDYDAPATRGQMAEIFANALPSSEYKAINSVTYIPDVAVSSEYYSAVYKLYNAGIVMGNDGYGTFEPDSSIKRCEAAAIINRIANKDSRLSKNLISYVPSSEAEASMFNMTSEAKYYMDVETFRNGHTGGYPSGWTLYPTLEKAAKSGVLSNVIYDSSEEREARLEFKINPAVSDGVLDFEFGVNMYGTSGAYLRFSDADEKSVLEIMLDNGEFKTLSSSGAYVPTGAFKKNSMIHFDMKIDMDSKKYTLGIDGAYVGEFELASDKAISWFNVGTTKEGWITVAPSYAFLRHNWLATEKFVNAPDNILPYDINVINEGGKVSKTVIYSDYSNGGSLSLASDAGSKTGISKKFAPASGNVVFETYILLPDELNGAKIALKSGDNDAFYLKTEGGNFVAPDGSAVKYVTKNLWHIVRFEADTASGTALVKINGKAIGTYPFASAASVIDGYEITYTPSSASTMYADEIAAFVQLPYPDDYVPEPVVPESDEYLVGLNVCSLWRTGTHYGWDEITAYPEIEPVLGYYDEGSPETSDWEIKMMSEHGIDYEIFCWYPDANVTAPIFRTKMNEAIIDGYMNARYSDKLDFAIMWENTSINCQSWESWTDYVVPYLIEYFFLDERYLKIDNKPFFTIWSLDQLNAAFGEKSAKEGLDYLREECRKAGFDGCMIMLYTSDHSASFAQSCKAAGIDCAGAYHYGTDGADVEKHLADLESLKNETTIDRIPAVSVGFDYVGWGNSKKRNGLLDPDDYSTVTDYIKDEILAERDQNSIFSKMVIISTWNEYGEGTYVMPTARHGFKYLDAVREAFTNGGEHTDVTPTEAQKQRINYLYDQDRQWLRPQLLVKEETVEKDPFDEAAVVEKITFEDPEAIKWGSYGKTEIVNKDGILNVTTTSNDPAILSNARICNISSDDANAVIIRAKIDGTAQGGSMELFFKTDDGKEYSADKVKTAKITLGEWMDYKFDFRQVATWTGNIVNLRIDPANFAFELAQIESITFVKLPEIIENQPFTVDINGKELSLIAEADRTAGGVMIPVYPEDGVFTRMKANHIWNKNTKELTVYNYEHTVTFTIGTDKIVIDGKEGKTYAKTYMYDGLPVIPFDTLCEALGLYVVRHEDDNGISVMLNSADDYHTIKTRVPYEYEFNIEGDMEDWTTQNCSADVYGGSAVGTSSGNDPALISPVLNLDASKYPTIKVRMKFDRNNVGKKDNISIYFKTATTALSESRKVYITLPEDKTSTNGEFEEFTFNMSEHLQWYGKIESIRVDPFNATGTFEIDYIKFEKDMASEMAELEKKLREDNLDDTIYNGDASSINYNPMTSGNAAITIVERDDEPGNNCYNVKANGGKVWTYFTQQVKFTPGTTYTVEFDARVTSLNDGSADPDISAGFLVNLQYDGDGTRDHYKHVGSAKISDGWQHFKIDLTVSEKCNNKNDVFAIFTNPTNDLGVNYQVDNVKMYPAE